MTIRVNAKPNTFKSKLTLFCFAFKNEAIDMYMPNRIIKIGTKTIKITGKE